MSDTCETKLKIFPQYQNLSILQNNMFAQTAIIKTFLNCFNKSKYFVAHISSLKRIYWFDHL